MKTLFAPGWLKYERRMLENRFASWGVWLALLLALIQTSRGLAAETESALPPAASASFGARVSGTMP